MTLTETEREIIADGSTWIDEHADELLDLLAGLVSRPGLSGEEGTHSDEDSPVGYLWEFLLENSGDAVNLDVQSIAEDYVDNDRENIYVWLDGPSELDGGLLCTSHTDVVPAGDHSDWPDGNPFDVTEGQVRHVGGTKIELALDDSVYEHEIREKMARTWRNREFDETDVLVGRGVFDNKASTVCLVGSMLALEAALEGRNSILGGSLIHGHLVDEEVYQLGIKRMVGWGGDDWFGERFDSTEFTAVVLEGSYGFVPVIGHRGLLWVVLEARGEGAHASTPEIGRNAVVGLSKAIVAVDGDDAKDELQELFVDGDYLGELTVAAGTTAVGGDVKQVDPETRTVDRGGLNSIPDWAEATFDLRIPRWKGFPEDVDTVADAVAERIEQIANNTTHEIEFTASVPELNYFPPVAIAEDECDAHEHPLVNTATAATRSIFGYEPQTEIAPGVTDAAFLYHGTHIPTLVEYGPAGGLSHERHEYVEREQVIEGAKAMLEFAVREVGLTTQNEQ